MQIDSQPSLQEKLNSIASAIGMRMNEQYGGSNAVQFAFEQPDVSNFVKMGQVLIHETSSDSSNDKDVSFGGDITPEAELQHKGTGMQRAFALAAIQVYAEQQREHSVDKSDEDNDGDSEKELPIISSLVALDEPDMALHPCAQYTLADSPTTRVSIVNISFRHILHICSTVTQTNKIPFMCYMQSLESEESFIPW
mgnify:CR=1 FL=1